MISIKIMGGFGNQLFQIFAALAYGIQHNIKVVFPYSSNMGHRHPYWDTFFKSILMFTTQNPANNCTDNDINKLQIYQERDFTYEAFPNFGDKSICLLGYFQSYKYFEASQSIIYNVLKLKEKKEIIKKKYGKYFENTDGDIISIHFRLGDYKEKRYYHPIMNYEYFEKSLDHIMMSSPIVSRVIYFCEKEDNEYVDSKIALFKAKYPEIEYIKVDDEIPDYDQVIIMSLTQHNIMSNSTFSWWGAYFNSNPIKVVCYPSIWFGEYYEHTHDHRDMMPESWIKITSKPIPWDQPLA